MAAHVQQVTHPKSACTFGFCLEASQGACSPRALAVRCIGVVPDCELLQVDQTCLLEVLQEEPTFDHQHFQDVKAVEGGSRVEPKPEGELPPKRRGSSCFSSLL